MEEISNSSTHAIEDHITINKKDHSRFLDDCLNEVIENGTLKCSRLILNDRLEEFDIKNKFDISELLSQEMNDMIENGEVELDNEKLEEMKDLKHMYTLQKNGASTKVAIPDEVKTFIKEFNDIFPTKLPNKISSLQVIQY
ncbi:LOW QUALITY PROTEIN: hypothetical protein PanWU01x14_330530 [Parasponia andersonii]|uniref:Uncharacterized protein n=1 Tax=Parasponia andersonii TaxID=3476 RepID=A0A2P5AI15_PARAD|nr:LOW QUALITY PROTEIN: hypothetical protein PanWU01x14_330530 [Parasponia andersonii]